MCVMCIVCVSCSVVEDSLHGLCKQAVVPRREETARTQQGPYTHILLSHTNTALATCHRLAQCAAERIAAWGGSMAEHGSQVSVIDVRRQAQSHSDTQDCCHPCCYCAPAAVRQRAGHMWAEETGCSSGRDAVGRRDGLLMSGPLSCSAAEISWTMHVS